MKRARARGGRVIGPTGPPAAPGLGRLVTVLIIALPIVVAALILRPRGDGPGRTGPTINDTAMLDSLRAADAKKDWVAALLWAERIGVRHPQDQGVMLARGTAWSNYAIDQRPGRVRPRQALRNSLQRMRCLRRALGLMDSSAMATRDSSRWMNSGVRLAQVNETIGLSGDALIAYETIKQRMPLEFGPALRAYWLRALCYDPVNPDTTEWHRRRIRLRGRR